MTALEIAQTRHISMPVHFIFDKRHGMLDVRKANIDDLRRLLSRMEDFYPQMIADLRPETETTKGD